ESSLNRGKIMMTGPGRAGKSATVRSLKGLAFDPNLESTIGADASATCSVTRNEVTGVNWEEKKMESAYAEQVAGMIKGSAGASSQLAPTPAPTPIKEQPSRRPSLLQRV